MLTRRTLVASLALTALSAHLSGASAEVYPSRPITMVVPFPAGGPTDTIARIVSERMSTILAQPIVIENVTGAAGTIGAGRVARATPDGYTLCAGFLGTHVLNGAIYSLQYDVVKDFEPADQRACGLEVARSAIHDQQAESSSEMRWQTASAVIIHWREPKAAMTPAGGQGGARPNL